LNLGLSAVFNNFKSFKNFPWQKHIKNQCVETCMA
jgi:hypothetical protein